MVSTSRSCKDHCHDQEQRLLIKILFLFETPGISIQLTCNHFYIVSHVFVCVCVRGGGGVGGRNTEGKWEGNVSRIKGVEEREDLVLRGLLQKER